LEKKERKRSKKLNSGNLLLIAQEIVEVVHLMGKT
jgi:hypothetical protein